MALEDLFSFFDPNLADTFSAKQRDPVAARAPLLKGLANVEDQFTNGRTKVPNKWWSASNGVVAFSPKLSGVPLVINGQTTNHIPQERFTDFLAAMRAEVEAGEFDKEIEQIEKGDGNAGSSVPVSPEARKRPPMSLETRERIAEGVRRRHAERRAARGE